MSDQNWKSKFDEPIELPDGRKLRTLKDAIAWLAKEIPKSEHTMPKVQVAARMVTEAAENGGPMIFARMGVLQAIYRYHVREFGTSRKPHHWGKRKLRRGRMTAIEDARRVTYCSSLPMNAIVGFSAPQIGFRPGRFPKSSSRPRRV
jgi:hypothetical protein